jgi:hypothetical protein
VGGKFSLQKNYIFKNPKPLLIIFSVLPFLTENEQNDILDTFIILFEECTIDCAKATEVNLMEKLFSYFEEESGIPALKQNITQKVISLIGILGSHSIKTRELKSNIIFLTFKELFQLMKNKKELKEDVSPLIIEHIRKMTRSKSPSSFFNFDGIENSGIIANGIQFPTTYTFSVWLRLERTSQSKFNRFFNLSTKDYNLELYFHVKKLVVQSVAGNKVSSIVFDHIFQTNRWYNITITHYKVRI